MRLRPWLLAPLLLLLGCPPSDPGPKGPVTLVVYVGRSEALVGDALKVFQRQYPEIKLDLRFGDSASLAQQALKEQGACPADLFWLQDAGHLDALAKAGLLEQLPARTHQRATERFRGADRRWVGISGRRRCLVVDSRVVKPKALPKNLKALADLRWKGKLGWSPGEDGFLAHVSYLRHAWGEEATKNWLIAMRENQPRSFPKSAAQVKACAKGELALGWVDHTALHRVQPEGPIKNHAFTEDDGGNLLMIAGAGIRKGSKVQEAATQLLEYLLSETIQSQLAERTYEYPVVKGIPPHADVPKLSSLQLAEAKPAQLTDLAPTQKLLAELGLR